MAKFSRKHVGPSFFFHKTWGLLLYQQRLWHRCLAVNCANFFRTSFLQSTSGRLILTSSSQQPVSFTFDNRAEKSLIQTSKFILLASNPFVQDFIYFFLPKHTVLISVLINFNIYNSSVNSNGTTAVRYFWHCIHDRRITSVS